MLELEFIGQAKSFTTSETMLGECTSSSQAIWWRRALLKCRIVIDIPLEFGNGNIKLNKRKVIYKAKDLMPKDLFGHYEVIKKIPRRYRVVPKWETKVFFINIKDFKKFFNTKQDLSDLLEQFTDIGCREVKEKIKENEFLKKAMQKAFYDGVGHNYVPDSNRIIQEHWRKSIKLRPWLNLCKKAVNVDPNICELKNDTNYFH
jgi:hypothetical protein